MDDAKFVVIEFKVHIGFARVHTRWPPPHGNAHQTLRITLELQHNSTRASSPPRIKRTSWHTHYITILQPTITTQYFSESVLSTFSVYESNLLYNSAGKSQFFVCHNDNCCSLVQHWNQSILCILYDCCPLESKLVL